MKQKMKQVLFTIIARNYIAQAKVLFNSFLKFHPNVDFYVVIADGNYLDPMLSALPFKVIFPKDLIKIDDINYMQENYDVMEFCTSIKPFAIMNLLIEKEYSKVIYLDPDIMIFSYLDEIWDELEFSNILLTPHIFEPIPLDGKIPSEVSLLQAGVYNLGFIAIKNSSESMRFLTWWSERLKTLCKSNVDKGLFVDQKWIDLVPFLFLDTKIIKNVGFNVAYWNLNSRRISFKDGVFYVNNEKLIFYHFSGFSPENPYQLSLHQNRFSIEKDSALEKLFLVYADELEKNGFFFYKNINYRTNINWNVIGYLSSEMGIGEAARGYVKALQACGYSYKLLDFKIGSLSRKNDYTLGDIDYSNFIKQQAQSAINLICINADQIPVFREHSDQSIWDRKYNIGVWWWEMPDFPEEWLNRFSYFDEIWVGSSYIQESLTKVSKIPIVKIPPALDFQPLKHIKKSDYMIDENKFLFLYIFDFLSVFERKNPIGVIKAFKQAFKNSPDLQLIIKCINGKNFPEKLEELKKEADHENIFVIDKYMNKEEKNGLIQICDCYVSLHRSEGFGLTIAEAMAFGKPVIVTGWSGNMDFNNVNNSYLVEYELEKLERKYGPYQIGQIWAKPNIDHAAFLMKFVYENYDNAKMKGARASIDIVNIYSSVSIGQKIEKRVQYINSKQEKIEENPKPIKKNKIHQILKNTLKHFLNLFLEYYFIQKTKFHQKIGYSDSINNHALESFIQKEIHCIIQKYLHEKNSEKSKAETFSEISFQREK